MRVVFCCVPRYVEGGAPNAALIISLQVGKKLGYCRTPR
jgi:hypothetical protein